MRNLISFRNSLLAAMGVATLSGCGAKTTLEDAPTGRGGFDGSGGDDGAGASSSRGASGGGTGQGGSAGVGGTGAEASTSTGLGPRCVDPKPIAQRGGGDSGYVLCADGSIDRAAAIDCAQPLPVGPSCAGTEASLACVADADCQDAPHGRCLSGIVSETGSTYCGCAYGCASDSECAPGAVCACASEGSELVPTPQCIPATCLEDDSCPSGECGFSRFDTGCGLTYALGCRSEGDACRTESECSGASCSPDPLSELYSCRTPDCAIGRPMTIEGLPRMAPALGRSDWSTRDRAFDGSLRVIDRAALLEHWRVVAALEHASIGSFARFALQLLALGAPPELLASTQEAMRDEIEHARIAYAIATELSGSPVGPGPLELAGAAIATDPASVVRSLVEEACVGETVGVAEAMHLARVVESPALAQTFRRIADDEQRHAELAWRTLAWLVRTDDALALVAADSLARAARALEQRPEVAHVARELGLLSADELVAVRLRALHDVVEPCMRAITGRA